MARRYFGTDGIRGRANSQITADMALKVGQAAGLAFHRGDHRHRVVIGKDTRLSSYMIEYALVAGFTSVGADVLLLGPVPTPAVAMLTRSMRCDLGVMISASHNPYEDNGIKLFGPDGYKLSDEVEARIEALMDGDVAPKLANSPDLGRAKRIDDVDARYIEYAKRTLSREVSLEGLRVVVDCANGAAYKVAPEALWELGAEVIKIGVEPNGLNINFEVGSTAPSRSWRRCRAARASPTAAARGHRAGPDHRCLRRGSLPAAQPWTPETFSVATVASNLGQSPPPDRRQREVSLSPCDIGSLPTIRPATTNLADSTDLKLPASAGPPSRGPRTVVAPTARNWRSDAACLIPADQISAIAR